MLKIEARLVDTVDDWDHLEGQSVHHQLASGSLEADNRFTVRLEFGWGSMTSNQVTDWAVRAVVAGGQLTGVFPCFAGGATFHEKVNRIVSRSSNEIRLEVYTARNNSRPTSDTVLQLQGDRATRVSVETSAVYQGQRCSCALSAPIGELLDQDQWAGISSVFSALKIRRPGPPLV